MIADFGFGVLVVTFILSFFSMGAALYGGLTKSYPWAESAGAPCCLPSRCSRFRPWR